MKTQLQITGLILVLIFAAFNPLMARDEYSRSIKREYTVNPDAQLTISNKYGKVHCSNWDKPVIAVEVTLRVEAPSEQAAQKMMDKILITMTGSATAVNVSTAIDKEGFQGRSKITIDYTINMPVTVNVDITNKFGDIYINEVTGKGKVNLSYGNMEVNKLGNSDNLLDLKFSQADIKWIQGAVVLLKYSELELDYAGSLRLDSKYSDLSAKKVISLNGNMEGGRLDMENSSAVENKSKFSDLDITRIEKSLTLDIQYGNFEVHEMPADFSTISIRNKYAEVTIGLPENANYQLDADLKFCDLDFPEGKADISQKIIENNSKKYKAVVGKSSTPISRVSVKSEFGNVSLMK
jgi:hypothetical protein